MRKSIWIGLGVISLLGIISLLVGVLATQESLPPQKQYGTVILWQTCDNSTFANITSIKVGSQIVSGRINLTEVSNDYYQLSFSNTSSLGTYVVTGICDENGLLTSWAYDFLITPSGEEWTNGTIFIITLLVLAIILLLISFIFQNYIFAFISGITFIVVGMYSMIYGFTTILSTYSQMISIVLIGLGMIISIVSAYEFAGETEEGRIDNNYEEEE